MSTTTLVSVEDYLRRTEKPNADYIDGVVYPKALPTRLHSALEHLLVILFQKAGLEAHHELTLRLSPTKYLVPDVAAAAHIEDPYPTEPVLLCVEILSPGEGLGAMLAKCEQYQNWGVPYCWVIDPKKETAWEYHKGGEPMRADRALRAGNVTIALDELFAELRAQ